MIILRNYQCNDKPVDLIMRLEEGMQHEGVRVLMETLPSLQEHCLPSENYVEKLPGQLRKQPQRLLILWLLLLMRHEVSQRTVHAYITAYAVSLEEEVDEILAEEARSWIEKELLSRIKEEKIVTTLTTMDELEPYRKQCEKGSSMWRFISSINITIYEKNQLS